MSCFCEEQILLLKSIHQSQGFWNIHVDSTGNCCHFKPSKGPIFYYAAQVPFEKDSHLPSLTVFEIVSGKHDVATLKTAWTSVFSIFENHVPPPAMIIIDWSWALLHSLLWVITRETIEEHLHRVWQEMIIIATPSKPVIRFCIAHFIKACQRRVAKMSVTKEVRLWVEREVSVLIYLHNNCLLDSLDVFAQCWVYGIKENL